MTTNNNNTRENSITVCFWTHCGGRFNNGGYKEYLDNITDFRQLLRVVPCLMLINTDDDGNLLPDDEWYIDDGGGNELLRGREEIESRTGTLDIDGIHDTYTVKDIDDCTEAEWQILLGCKDDYMSSSVRKAVEEHYGLSADSNDDDGE